MSVWGQFMKREDASSYIDKDADMPRVLRTKDFLALGVGTIVSTSIFTLPGVVAAKYAGPAVVLSFLAAAVVVWLTQKCRLHCQWQVQRIHGLVCYLVKALAGLLVGPY